MGKCKSRPVKGINAKQFAKTLLSGATIQAANLAAGYAPSRAARGKDCASKACWVEYKRQFDAEVAKLSELGKITPEQQEAMIRGKLVKNVTEGVDESTASLKMLGQDKRIAMFTPETMTGIIVLQAPRNLPPLPSHIEGIAPDPVTIDSDEALRGRFFQMGPEHEAWRASAEGREARRRLTAKGLLEESSNRGAASTPKKLPPPLIEYGKPAPLPASALPLDYNPDAVVTHEHIPSIEELIQTHPPDPTDDDGGRRYIDNIWQLVQERSRRADIASPNLALVAPLARSAWEQARKGVKQ